MRLMCAINASWITINKQLRLCVASRPFVWARCAAIGHTTSIHTYICISTTPQKSQETPTKYEQQWRTAKVKEKLCNACAKNDRQSVKVCAPQGAQPTKRRRATTAVNRGKQPSD